MKTNTRRNRRSGSMRKQRGGAMSQTVRSRFSELSERVGELQALVEAECGAGAGAATLARPAAAAIRGRSPSRAAAAADAAEAPAARAVSRGRSAAPKATSTVFNAPNGRIRSRGPGARNLTSSFFLAEYKKATAALKKSYDPKEAAKMWKEYQESGKPTTQTEIIGFLSKKFPRAASGAAAGGGGGMTDEEALALM